MTSPLGSITDRSETGCGQNLSQYVESTKLHVMMQIIFWFQIVHLLIFICIGLYRINTIETHYSGTAEESKELKRQML